MLLTVCPPILAPAAQNGSEKAANSGPPPSNAPRVHKNTNAFHANVNVDWPTKSSPRPFGSTRSLRRFLSLSSRDHTTLPLFSGARAEKGEAVAPSSTRRASSAVMRSSSTGSRSLGITSASPLGKSAVDRSIRRRLWGKEVGGRPVARVSIVAPKPYRSEALDARPWNCSGAIKPYVPIIVLPVVSTSAMARCTPPKSTRKTPPDGSSALSRSKMMLSGLISRWMTGGDRDPR
mmetsp:Transcript_17707/g.35724  ORF Transcript_17707/g.35724 Transcript_17707/m.35724 type:complete len:234 (-) Transcript_17707:383-1084(-)